MCFSTAASFAAGSVLTFIGIATIRKVDNPHKIMLATIPFVFAIQQFSEGFVWISELSEEDKGYREPAVYFFLVIAMVLWPSWVSLAIYFFEQDLRRKPVLKVIALTGVLFSFLSAYYLLNYPSGAHITAFHVHYDLHVPYGLATLFGILYLIPTVISHFFSSNKKVVVMGVLVLCSYLISFVFFKDYLLSVWCFFSAIISVMIYSIIAVKSAPSIRQPIHSSIKKS